MINIRKSSMVAFVAAVALCGLGGQHVFAQFAESAGSNRVLSGIEEIVRTAKNSEQNVNDVAMAMAMAMAIDTAMGKKIKDLGITDTFDIGKLISGFTANLNYYGSAVYTIRGVGLQDTALASPQTVSVNIDQMPIPFAAMTNGVILDFNRVGVFKDPQGTLFGMNTTGER